MLRGEIWSWEPKLKLDQKLFRSSESASRRILVLILFDKFPFEVPTKSTLDLSIRSRNEWKWAFGILKEE